MHYFDTLVSPVYAYQRLVTPKIVLWHPVVGGDTASRTMKEVQALAWACRTVHANLIFDDSPNLDLLVTCKPTHVIIEGGWLAPERVKTLESEIGGLWFVRYQDLEFTTRYEISDYVQAGVKVMVTEPLLVNASHLKKVEAFGGDPTLVMYLPRLEIQHFPNVVQAWLANGLEGVADAIAIWIDARAARALWSRFFRYTTTPDPAADC